MHTARTPFAVHGPEGVMVHTVNAIVAHSARLAHFVVAHTVTVRLACIPGPTAQPFSPSLPPDYNHHRRTQRPIRVCSFDGMDAENRPGL